LELLWKCRDIALLNKLRISNEGFKTGDHRTGEEGEGKDQRLCKDYFGETNASWRPSCYEKKSQRGDTEADWIRQVRGHSDVRYQKDYIDKSFHS